MSKIYENLTQLIGNTPIMKINNFKAHQKLDANLLVKIEYFNPLSSVKDRVGCALIEDGEKKGLINKDTLIIEPTSGNTGIGLAFTAAAKGYRLILTMPETMSMERRQLLKALGAEIVLTDGAKGMTGAIDKANELKAANANAYIPGQFTNPANPAIHKQTTAKEIWEDTDGEIDFFVSAIGTGGTITGIGQYLKEKNPSIQVIGVEPEASPFLTKGESGPHKIQGIGAGFKPDILDLSVIDKIITVSDDDAIQASRLIGKTEGLLVGVSSGAALVAAEKIASSQDGKVKTILVLLPDTGERYLSSNLY